MVNQMGKNLTGMLFVGQSIDGGNVTKCGELFDIALSECANDRTIEQAADNPRGIFNWFSTSKLDIRGRQKHHVATQFSNATSNEMRVRVEDFENINAQH